MRSLMFNNEALTCELSLIDIQRIVDGFTYQIEELEKQLQGWKKVYLSGSEDEGYIDYRTNDLKSRVDHLRTLRGQFMRSYNGLCESMGKIPLYNLSYFEEVEDVDYNDLDTEC